MELYRQSTIGIALTDSLDDLIQNGLIDPHLAMKILSQFDQTIAEALHSKVNKKMVAKGHLNTYRFCDDVWTFILQNASFKMDAEHVTAEKIKVVACNGSK